MSRLSYEGVSVSGQPVSGVATAPNVGSLREQLRLEGILLRNARPVPRQWITAKVIPFRRHEGLVTRYLRHLATLLGAGVPLSKALQAVAGRAQGAGWRRVTADVSERVTNGSSLADALAAHERVFTALITPVVMAGERSGRLAAVLERLAAYREKSEGVRRKVRGALVYPAVVTCVAVAVIWIMLAHVVPTFSEMFANFGGELPVPTRILLAVSKRTTIWGPIVLVTVIGAMLAVQVVRLRPRWRLAIACLACRIPLLGETLAKIAMARVARTAATLLENGVPLLPSLQAAAGSAGNAAFERIFLNAADAVAGGQQLTDPLVDERILPPLTVQILSTGEETATMARMFSKLADFCESEADEVVGVVTSVLEPALVVVMGVIVAGILIALYLPMFEVLGQIGG